MKIVVESLICTKEIALLYDRNIVRALFIKTLKAFLADIEHALVPLTFSQHELNRHGIKYTSFLQPLPSSTPSHLPHTDI